MDSGRGGVLKSNKVNNYSIEMSVWELLPCTIARQYSLQKTIVLVLELHVCAKGSKLVPRLTGR